MFGRFVAAALLVAGIAASPALAPSAPPSPVASPTSLAPAVLHAPQDVGKPTMGASNPQAGTQVNIPPVILDRCRIDYGGNLVLGNTGKLDVEFTNESNVTADLVRIRVDLLGNITNVRDVGTFSPGVSVRHRVRNEQGQIMVFPVFGGRKNRAHCTITMVRFTDGTTWVSPTFSEEQQGS